MVDVTCVGCGEMFQAKTRRSKWCKPSCKQAVHRGGGSKDRADDDDDVPSNLVDSVRRELERAKAIDTFAGQLALQLAKRLSTPQESGISSLSKELRTVMAAALEGRTPPAAEAEPEDEVDKARRARDAKARKAAG